MWVTKDKIIWSPNTESHSEIAEEFKLHVDGARGANAVKIEIVPVGNDFRLPLTEWVFRTDQDDFPKWYDATDAEMRVREVLPEWLAHKVILPDQYIEELNHNVLICYGSIGVMRESSQVRVMRESSQVREMRESSQVREMWESSQVGVMRESSQVGVMRESSQVREMWGSSQVAAYTHIDPTVLHSTGAVIIDRSGSDVVCHVGSDNSEVIQ